MFLSTPLQISVMTARIATGEKIIPSIMKDKNVSFKKLNIKEKNLIL